MSHDRGHNLLQLLLQYWRIDSLSLCASLYSGRKCLCLLSAHARNGCGLLLWMSDDKDVAKAMKRACVRTRCVCVCLCACLTCDPGATPAAYGSNWAARKLTKCQWSVVPQEVINCGPRGQWGSSVSIYFLPQTAASAWITPSTIYYVSLKHCQASCCWTVSCMDSIVRFVLGPLLCTVSLILKMLRRGKLQQTFCYWFSSRKTLIQCLSPRQPLISTLLARSGVSLQTIPSLFVCLFLFSPTAFCPVIFHCQWAKLGGMVWEVGRVKGAAVVCRPQRSERAAICWMVFWELHMFSCKSLFGKILLVPSHWFVSLRGNKPAIISQWNSSTQSNITAYASLSPSSHIAQTPRRPSLLRAMWGVGCFSLLPPPPLLFPTLILIHPPIPQGLTCLLRSSIIRVIWIFFLPIVPVSFFLSSF